MCLYPKLIKNKKYQITKKNKGIIPECKDNRVKLIPAKCGKCMECVKAKAREWQIRITEDIRHNKNGKFITLTFSNESISELYNDLMEEYTITPEGYELDNKIATLGVRRFLERWRKEYKKSLRHWLITEIGHEGTENIHIHGIVWTNESYEKIRKHWKYGYIYPRTKNEENTNYVNEATANYITKYITKTDEKHKEFQGKILTSSGIGGGYITREDARNNSYKNNGSTKESYTSRTGHKIALPIYWRNKIYTEQEREQLWIEKLDKYERWVGGEKISIKNGDEEYYKSLEYHRKKATKLGYKDDKKNWDRIKYENDRRELNLKSRLNTVEIQEKASKKKINTKNN